MKKIRQPKLVEESRGKRDLDDQRCSRCGAVPIAIIVRLQACNSSGEDREEDFFLCRACAGEFLDVLGPKEEAEAIA